MPDSETVVRASEIAPIVIALALAVVVVAFVAITRQPPRRWLPTAGSVMVLLSFTFAALEPLIFLGFPLLAATFPDGRFVPRWMTAPTAAMAVFTFLIFVTRDDLTDQAWWPWVASAQILLLGGQVYRYRRRATTQEREAVRWVILGTLVTVASFALVAVIFEGPIGEGPTGSVVGASLAGFPLMLGLVGGAIRPDWIDVDRLLHATILGCLAVPLFGLLYAVTGGWTGAVAVGLASWPVGYGARWVADWVVYRGRPSANAAVARMLAKLAGRAAGDSVPQIVLDSAAEAVFLDGGTITGAWFNPLTRGDVATEHAFPVLYRGHEIAELTLSPRRGESGFTARDRRVIAELVVHAAPALYADRTLAELVESRARVVSAREEERRRLRRDLHDDLGPALSGLSLSAAALARRTGLTEAAELHEDIQQAVVQSREIAYGLRPPILDDHGLLAAIAERTRADDDLEVAVSGPEHLELPAAVDLAALRIAGEAVANTRKHAGASRVDVRIGLTESHLEIEIHDDGRGLPEDVRAGIGMHSIAERAAEVGGTARYDRAANGTRLIARLPLEQR